MAKNYTAKRSYWALMGIPFILYGVFIMKDPVYYSGKFQMEIDLGGVNFILGPLLIVVGVILIWRFVVPPKRHVSLFKSMICIQCCAAYTPAGIERHTCPKCGGELETIEGFYERHPELKNTE